MSREELLAGLRRFAILSAGAVVVIVVASLLLGELTGSHIRRAVSVGLYLGGSAAILMGLFQAVRPPVRIDEGEGRPPSAQRMLMGGPTGLHGDGPARWAKAEEVGESYATAALLLVLGVLMVLAGTVVDGRRPLV